MREVFKMREVARFDPKVGSIEGEVETEAEKAERERREIERKRKELSNYVKSARREVDEAKFDYRLAKTAAGVSAAFPIPLGIGWFMATTWGIAANFTGGEGGAISFCMVGLIIFTIINIICLCCSISWCYDKRAAVTMATDRHADALEASADFNIELLG
jgi:hypothetical protein